MTTTYFYTRVSLEEQTTENQKLAAKAAGLTIDECFTDHGVSGGVKAMERPEFARMAALVKAGDILAVNSVDRIGRDTVDVLSTVEMFQAKGVKVCVLAYGNLDLTSDMGKMILTIAAGFAALERSNLRTRTKQGMARTKAQGTKLGRPLKITPDTLADILKDRDAGVPLEGLSQKYKIPRNTIHKNVAKWAGKVEDYRVEYKAREVQYAASKLN
jgi:DNA invertase Pin-like site-specific DNA recombinase